MIGIIKFVSFLVKSFEKNLKYLLTNLLIDVYCQSVINLVRSKFDILLGNALVDFSKFIFLTLSWTSHSEILWNIKLLRTYNCHSLVISPPTFPSEEFQRYIQTMPEFVSHYLYERFVSYWHPRELFRK